MPDNQEDKNPEGAEPQGSREAELEGLIAEKDAALAAKEQRIAELEQALTERDERLTELETKQTELAESLAQAIASYRALALKYNPSLPEEQVSGDSVEEIDASLASAQALINRVRQELEAEMAAARIPAGAPQRTPADLSTLSPRDKIQYAIGERR